MRERSQTQSSSILVARWAIGLNHLRVPGAEGLRQSWTAVRLNHGGTYPYGFGWSLDQQRGFPRIGHTGSWQGFKTSIQRYPEQDLTVIAMANLAEARPEAITLAVAGILEPALRPPQVIAESPFGSPPPQPIPDLLREIASQGRARLTPGLARFVSGEFREALGELLHPARQWTWKGCDEVSARRLERLGSAIRRICYAAGSGKDAASLVEVDYSADGRAAFVDWYDF